MIKTLDFYAITLKNLMLYSKRIIAGMLCTVMLCAGVSAQDIVTYNIISTTGKIVDKKTGKTLNVGDKIILQTELQFNSLYDRAVVLSPSHTRHFLELPKTSFVNSQLTVTSDQALTPIKSRPKLVTGIRGSATLRNSGVGPQTLKDYFGNDTFTIIGPELALPVAHQDAAKFELLLRYENGGRVEEYVATGMTISKKGLKLQGTGIAECYVILKENGQNTPVTQTSLFFIEKKQLFVEFDSLLNALNINKKKDDKNKTSDVLRQYCDDVYGTIDDATLEKTITEYLK